MHRAWIQFPSAHRHDDADTVTSMAGLRVLIIGGNGVISGSVSRLAIERGMQLTLLNRGRDSTRPPIEGAESIVGDAGDAASVRSAVGAREFDVVVNFR